MLNGRSAVSWGVCEKQLTVIVSAKGKPMMANNRFIQISSLTMTHRLKVLDSKIVV
jgi:hypothetical protein